MSFSMSKSGMASFDLGGHGGQPKVPHDPGSHPMRLCAKFQPPSLKTVYLYKEHTSLQTGNRVAIIY